MAKAKAVVALVQPRKSTYFICQQREFSLFPVNPASRRDHLPKKQK